MPRGVGLSRAKVLDLAQAIADSEGAEALTLTRIAAAAGVRKPSLYKHVQGMPDIVDSLTLRAYRGLQDTVESAPGPDAGSVREIAHRWRQWALEHPGLYAIATRTHVGQLPPVFAAGAALIDCVLEHLRAAGVPPADAIDAARSFRALVHGFVMLELANGFGLDAPVDASFDKSVDALARGWGLT